MKVITNGEEPLKLKPALGRVQHLILKTSLDRTEFYGITFFLNSCPNLEQLTFDLNARPRVFPVSVFILLLFNYLIKDFLPLDFCNF